MMWIAVLTSNQAEALAFGPFDSSEAASAHAQKLINDIWDGLDFSEGDMGYERTELTITCDELDYYWQADFVLLQAPR